MSLPVIHKILKNFHKDLVKTFENSIYSSHFRKIIPKAIIPEFFFEIESYINSSTGEEELSFFVPGDFKDVLGRREVIVDEEHEVLIAEHACSSEVC